MKILEANEAFDEVPPAKRSRGGILTAILPMDINTFTEVELEKHEIPTLRAAIQRYNATNTATRLMLRHNTDGVYGVFCVNKLDPRYPPPKPRGPRAVKAEPTKKKAKADK